MKSHFQLSDTQFVEAFEKLSLDHKLFTHEAHLRLAWIHIKRYGVVQAIENLRIQIKRFAHFHGDTTKFNMTLTMAAVRAVYHFYLKSESANFKLFITEFSRLKHHFKDLMNHHYGFDIYNDPKAKSECLEPDLTPFD